MIRLCRACGRYSLKGSCPICRSTTVMPLPPRYSPEDRYGEYRRRLKKEVSKHG